MPTVSRPWFRPDPTLDRSAMKRLQYDLAQVAAFDRSDLIAGSDHRIAVAVN